MKTVINNDPITAIPAEISAGTTNNATTATITTQATGEIITTTATTATAVEAPETAILRNGININQKTQKEISFLNGFFKFQAIFHVNKIKLHAIF
jgi:hypothetical protein